MSERSRNTRTAVEKEATSPSTLDAIVVCACLYVCVCHATPRHPLTSRRDMASRKRDPWEAELGDNDTAEMGVITSSKRVCLAPSSASTSASAAGSAKPLVQSVLAKLQQTMASMAETFSETARLASQVHHGSKAAAAASLSSSSAAAPLTLGITAPAPAPKFSKTQQEAFEEVVVERKSAFITGPAGTGKSFLEDKIYDAMTGQGLQVRKTASTGNAAFLIQGVTLHSWIGAGVPSPTATVAELVAKVSKKKDIVEDIQTTDVLMSDEISMQEPSYFALAERVVAHVRGRPDLPWGGLQTIFFGDFLQLPPIKPDHIVKAEANEGRVKIDFVFELKKAWTDKIETVVELETIFRQNDDLFTGILNRARFGKNTPRDFLVLNGRVNAPVENCMELRAYRKEVEVINQRHIDSLDTQQPYSFYAASGYECNDPDEQRDELTWAQEEVLRELRKSCPVETVLTLKRGCRVIHRANVDVVKGLINGTAGFIEDFIEDEEKSSEEQRYYIPVMRTDNGQVFPIKRFKFMAPDRGNGFAWIMQTPLVLGAACTVHGAQGRTIERARFPLDRSLFAESSAYVLLSRLKSLEGLSLVGAVDPDCFKPHFKALKFYKRQREKRAIANAAAASAMVKRTGSSSSAYASSSSSSSASVSVQRASSTAASAAASAAAGPVPHRL
jgi:ATP-dependent DNA helicase PIF1